MFERLPPSRKFVVQIFIFIACICGVFFFISNQARNFNTKEYVIYFDRSIRGLNIGNSVFYKGVPIGVVEEIKVDLPRFERVAVVVKIDKKMPIYNSFVAKIGMQGLTGHSIIELENRAISRKPILLDGKIPEIRSEYSNIEKLFEDVPALISSAKELVVTIHKILQRNDGSINDGIRNFAKALESLSGAFDKVSIGAGTFNRCASKLELGILPKTEIAVENWDQLMKNLNKDWDTFSKGSLLQLIDLINNLNNLSNNMNEMMLSDRTVFGYLLGV